MIVFDSLNSPKLISRKISDSEIHKNCLTFQTLTRLFQTLARIFVTTQVNYSKTRSIWRRTGKWKMAMKQQIFPWIHFANGTSFEIHWTMGPFGNFFLLVLAPTASFWANLWNYVRLQLLLPLTIFSQTLAPSTSLFDRSWKWPNILASFLAQTRTLFWLFLTFYARLSVAWTANNSLTMSGIFIERLDRWTVLFLPCFI